ncbi:MAG: helix-turn-helix domain-containing protein [Thermodesulfobacteriota bacterium]
MTPALNLPNGKIKTLKKIERDLLEFCKNIINDYKQIYPDLPDSFLNEQSEFISWLAARDAEISREVWTLSGYALDVLENSIPSTKQLTITAIENDNIKLWHPGNLLHDYLSQYKNDDFLIAEARNYSFAGTILGLTLMFLLGIRRWERHLTKKRTLDHLFLFHASELESDKYSQAALNSARKRLSEKAMRYYNQKRKSKIDDEHYFTVFVWEYLYSLTDDSTEMMELCESGDVKIRTTVRAAALDMKDEDRKFKETRWEDIDNKLIEDIKDLTPLSRIYDIVLANKILSKNKDILDKQIAQMLYEGYTVREIASELSKPKSVIQDHIKKLDQLA